MLFTYNCLLYLLLPLLPLRLLWRSRNNAAYRTGWYERFACYGNKVLFPESIWIHAVSLGEAVAATPLVQALRKDYPLLPIVFTVMTPTGAAHVQHALGNEVTQLYVPYDYPFAVKKFLKTINPKFLIIMETELWPNILYYSKKSKLPIFLVNARLTERSFNNYCKIPRITKMMLDCIDTVFAQSQKDAEYFLQLGVDISRIRVSGNIKFDIAIPKDIKECGQQLRQQWQSSGGGNRPVWIAASTHAGEEIIVLNAFKKILQHIPDALLILVPRHINRCNEIARLCQQQRLNVSNYIATDKNRAYSTATNVALVNVVGQLLLLYASADVAFIGGSLIAGIGGHNVLEPAALALPIIVGPYTETLADIRTKLESADGLINVTNADDLAENVLLLLQNTAMRQKYGEAAYKVVEQNRGVINDTLEMIYQKI